ncbi:MAG: nicotinate (nicotinamide) nucleotide adenylyltransferase [Candidatus Dormiibacterota bacterium]
MTIRAERPFEAQGSAVLFGGTFDPPHLGHVAAIRELRRVTGLPVVVVPTGAPTYRPSPHASAIARAEMAELAVHTLADPLVTVCRWEVDRVEPTFTVDTVEWLRAQDPDLALVLALGSDVASTLPGWKSVRRLLAQVRLLIFERARQHRLASETGQAVVARLRRSDLPLPGAEVISLSTPAIDATRIRERIAAGASTEGMLPSEVADYIHTHRLYLHSDEPGSGTVIG